MRDVNNKRLSICEVLRSINDKLQGDGFNDVRDMLALAEQMAKKMITKLVEYNKVNDREWWDKNPEYVEKLNRSLETYLVGDPEKAKIMLHKNNNFNRGIVFVVFGEDYDNLAAQTIACSRKYITLPVTIITNLKTRSYKWNSIESINFIYLDMPTDKNREVKIELYKYTQYEETLFVDCDAIFIKDGIENIFDNFNGKDLILQSNSMPCWDKDKRYFKIYREAAATLGVELPLNIYQGGIFAFKKTDETIKFFTLWKEYWKQLGSGRDMPAFACAVKNSGVKHSTITKDNKFFIFGNDPETIINHPTGRSFLAVNYNIEYCKPNKKFDEGKKDDWSMVFFNQKSDEIINDPWVIKKFDRKKRIIDKERYIEKYLPEINKGGLDILDVACGPGELLELAIKRGNNPVGIETCSGMFNREKDFLYEKYNLLRHKEKNLPVIYCDVNNMIEFNEPKQKIFDIINCQHAINFIAKVLFDYHPEREYKNDGEWIINEKFEQFFNRYFLWCTGHLKNNGVVMLAALHSINEKEYSENIQKIGISNGYKIEISEKNLNHKFRLAA